MLRGWSSKLLSTGEVLTLRNTTPGVLEGIDQACLLANSANTTWTRCDGTERRTGVLIVVLAAFRILEHFGLNANQLPLLSWGAGGFA